MGKTILIKNARIINPDSSDTVQGDILIRDGIIENIQQSIASAADSVIDARGFCASPGLVDMHVHMRDPGQTYKDDVLSVSGCAAAGGVTAIACMPNTIPPADCEDVLRYIGKKAHQAPVRIYPVAAITKGLMGKEITDMQTLRRAGAVAFSDDGNPVSDPAVLLPALRRAMDIRSLILAHCEERSVSAGGLVNEGKTSAVLQMRGIPSAAETDATVRDIEIARQAKARIHICHVSTAGAAQAVRQAKKRGVAVTAETCPHYFALNDEMLLQQDADYRMNPPLRSEEDRKAIIEALSDGTIDCIATDHAPHTQEEKSDFISAPNGVIGLETSLAAGITYLVETGIVSLAKLIFLMSASPARILGIEGGVLAQGRPADIVLYDPSEKWRVDPLKLHGKSSNTPFKNLELKGRVKYTICKGEIVFPAYERMDANVS